MAGLLALKWLMLAGCKAGAGIYLECIACLPRAWWPSFIMWVIDRRSIDSGAVAALGIVCLPDCGHLSENEGASSSESALPTENR